MHRYAGIEVIGVSTGWEHTCAVASGGGVWCFGGNNYGQLGIGNTTDQHSPSAVSLGAGDFVHSCELVIFGLLYPWMRVYSVILLLFSNYLMPIFTVLCRQWPEVYDLCHTFLHVARVKKHTAVRESHVKRVQFSNVRVFSDSRNVQKRATKPDTSGHCLVLCLVLIGWNQSVRCLGNAFEIAA